MTTATVPTDLAPVRPVRPVRAPSNGRGAFAARKRRPRIASEIARELKLPEKIVSSAISAVHEAIQPRLPHSLRVTLSSWLCEAGELMWEESCRKRRVRCPQQAIQLGLTRNGIPRPLHGQFVAVLLESIEQFAGRQSVLCLRRHVPELDAVKLTDQLASQLQPFLKPRQ